MKCGYCGKEFEPSPYQKRQIKNGLEVFCSTSCSSNYRYKKVQITPDLVNSIKDTLENTLLNYTEIQKEFKLTKSQFEYILNEYNLKRSTEQINKIKILRAKQTMMDKYGVDNAMKVKEFRQKISDSLNNKTQEEIHKINKKREQTKLERYGDRTYRNKEKAKQTMMDKYGVAYGFNLEKCKLKGKEAMKRKYKCEFPRSI